MKDILKSVIPNVIFFFGFLIVSIGNKLVMTSAWMHKKLRTNAGMKIIEFETEMAKLEENLKEMETALKLKDKGGFFVDGDGGNA